MTMSCVSAVTEVTSDGEDSDEFLDIEGCSDEEPAAHEPVMGN